MRFESDSELRVQPQAFARRAARSLRARPRPDNPVRRGSRLAEASVTWIASLPSRRSTCLIACLRQREIVPRTMNESGH